MVRHAEGLAIDAAESVSLCGHLKDLPATQEPDPRTLATALDFDNLFLTAEATAWSAWRRTSARGSEPAAHHCCQRSTRSSRTLSYASACPLHGGGESAADTCEPHHWASPGTAQNAFVALAILRGQDRAQSAHAPHRYSSRAGCTAPCPMLDERLGEAG